MLFLSFISFVLAINKLDKAIEYYKSSKNIVQVFGNAIIFLFLFLISIITYYC